MKFKVIIFFIAGAALGSVTTWYFTKKKYDEEVEEMSTQFCEKVKELKNNKATADKKEEESAPVEEDPVSATEKNNAMIDSLLEGVKKIQNEHKYKAYADVENDRAENSEHGASEVKGSEDYKRKVDIEKIDYETYEQEDDGFEKCGITKYEDNVFTDDADQVMSDGYISETIGMDIRNEMIDSNMLDAVYVRNHKTHRDYEIICDLDSYEVAHQMNE